MATIIDRTTHRAFRFFQQHAGGVVGESAKTALALARAETWAADKGLEYVWTPDDDGADTLGDHEYWCDRARRREDHEHEIWGCVLYRPCEDHGTDCPHADVLASLWGNIDPDADYRRVIEAELALEAMTTHAL